MPVNVLNLTGLGVVDFRETATKYHVRAKPKAISRRYPGCGAMRKAFVQQQKTLFVRDQSRRVHRAGCNGPLGEWVLISGLCTRKSAAP